MEAASGNRRAIFVENIFALDLFIVFQQLALRSHYRLDLFARHARLSAKGEKYFPRAFSLPPDSLSGQNPPPAIGWLRRELACGRLRSLGVNAVLPSRCFHSANRQGARLGSGYPARVFLRLSRETVR